MKSTLNIILTITLLSASMTIGMSQCYTTDDGGACNPPDQPASAGNNCERIEYTPQGNATYCDDNTLNGLEEILCGATMCTANSVEKNETHIFWTVYVGSDNKVACKFDQNSTFVGPSFNGYCEQDYIPSPADNCGNCN